LVSRSEDFEEKRVDRFFQSAAKLLDCFIETTFHVIGNIHGLSHSDFDFSWNKKRAVGSKHGQWSDGNRNSFVCVEIVGDDRSPLSDRADIGIRVGFHDAAAALKQDESSPLLHCLLAFRDGISFAGIKVHRDGPHFSDGLGDKIDGGDLYGFYDRIHENPESFEMSFKVFADEEVQFIFIKDHLVGRKDKRTGNYLIDRKSILECADVIPHDDRRAFLHKIFNAMGIDLIDKKADIAPFVKDWSQFFEFLFDRSHKCHPKVPLF
jgi:hypothetical protein